MAPTYVTAQLRPDIAEQLRSGSPTTEAADEVLRVVGERGLQLRPVTPESVIGGVANDALRSTFVVETLGEAEAMELREALQRVDAVEGAYIKQAAAPP
ncbi:MAG: hypothetical protein QOK00_915 [Thermoleophilaceae bacterium]|jgi:hypothetical protein|nr:hypothetical protein [Thermoleophilaceae bacterium]